MKMFAMSAALFLLFSGEALAQAANSAAPAAPAAPTAPAAPAAQTAAPASAPAATGTKRVKMGALLASGYEIKSTAIVTQEISSRIAGKPDSDGVLVTLQKGSTAATCLFSLSQYIQPGMLDIIWCIEQK